MECKYYKKLTINDDDKCIQCKFKHNIMNNIRIARGPEDNLMP